MCSADFSLNILLVEMVPNQVMGEMVLDGGGQV